MSAPQTNLKKQTTRHKGPLIGMVIAVVVALSALVWMLSANLTGDPDTPENPTAPVEGTVGPPAEGSVSDPGGQSAPPMDETAPAPAD